MQSAEKISITLPPDMLRLIREAVAAGEYASTSEALRDAVRTWQHQRLEDAERLAALRARAQASLADPAPSLSEADVDARLAARVRRRRCRALICATVQPRSPTSRRSSGQCYVSAPARSSLAATSNAFATAAGASPSCLRVGDSATI